MRSAILAILVILAGCAVRHIEQPQDGPRARVRFVANNTYATHVRQDADDCNPESRRVIAQLGRLAVIADNPGKIGMPALPDVPDKTVTEIHVPAGKPFNFTLSFGMGGIYADGVSCAVTVAFEPRAYVDYEVVFGTEDRSCRADVSRITGTGPFTRVPEQTARKSVNQCKHFGGKQ